MEGHDFSRAASTANHRGFSRWGKLERDELTLCPPHGHSILPASLEDVLSRTRIKDAGGVSTHIQAPSDSRGFGFYASLLIEALPERPVQPSDKESEYRGSCARESPPFAEKRKGWATRRPHTIVVLNISRSSLYAYFAFIEIRWSTPRSMRGHSGPRIRKPNHAPAPRNPNGPMRKAIVEVIPA